MLPYHRQHHNCCCSLSAERICSVHMRSLAPGPWPSTSWGQSLAAMQAALVSHATMHSRAQAHTSTRTYTHKSAAAPQLLHEQRAWLNNMPCGSLTQDQRACWHLKSNACTPFAWRHMYATVFGGEEASLKPCTRQEPYSQPDGQ